MNRQHQIHFDGLLFSFLWVFMAPIALCAQSGWQFQILDEGPRLQSARVGQKFKSTSSVFSSEALKSYKEVNSRALQSQAFGGDSEAPSSVDKILQYLLQMNAIMPSGAPKDPVKPQCRGDSLEKKILGSGGNIDQNMRVMQTYLNECEDHISRNNDRSFFSLLNEDLIQYDVAQLPNYAPFRLTTPNGEILQGLILARPGPRPWVVVKCGVFCEVAKDSRSLNVMMHLFDESPFNVMAINNDVSPASIVDNRRVHVGGLFEGQSLFRAAYWLKHISPYKDQVAAVHGMGISLGGSSSLYASLYNDYNKVAGEKVFNSFISYCPEVNTGPTLQDIFSKSLKGYLFGYKTWGLIKQIYPFVEDVRRLVSLDHAPKSNEYPSLLGLVTINFFARQSTLDFLKPFQTLKPISTLSELWEINNFSEMAYGMQTPTLVLASDDDWVVKTSLNASDLADKFNHDPNTQIRVVNMKYGNHCGSSLVYGWAPISKIMRGYFMAHSASASPTAEEINQPLNYKRPTLTDTDVIADYAWAPALQQNKIELILKVWNSRTASHECTHGASSPIGWPPYNRNPFTSDRSCYVSKKIKLSYEQFGNLGVTRPLNEASLQALSRFLNANFVPTANGQTIVGGRLPPDNVLLKQYSFSAPK